MSDSEYSYFSSSSDEFENDDYLIPLGDGTYSLELGEHYSMNPGLLPEISRTECHAVHGYSVVDLEINARKLGISNALIEVMPSNFRHLGVPGRLVKNHFRNILSLDVVKMTRNSYLEFDIKYYLHGNLSTGIGALWLLKLPFRRYMVQNLVDRKFIITSGSGGRNGSLLPLFDNDKGIGMSVEYNEDWKWVSLSTLGLLRDLSIFTGNDVIQIGPYYFRFNRFFDLSTQTGLFFDDLLWETAMENSRNQPCDG